MTRYKVHGLDKKTGAQLAPIVVEARNEKEALWEAAKAGMLIESVEPLGGVGCSPPPKIGSSNDATRTAKTNNRGQNDSANGAASTGASEDSSPAHPPASMSTDQKPSRTENRRKRLSRPILIAAVLTGFLLLGGATALGVLFGTSKNPEKAVQGNPAKGDPVRVNSETFKALYRVAKEIEGAQEVGVNRADFGKLLQRCATELNIARENLKTFEERKIFDCYNQAFETWKDSDTLWGVKVALPVLERELEDRVSRLKVVSETTVAYQVILRNGGLPTRSYPDVVENDVGRLARKYKLTVMELREWDYVEGNCLNVLWELAAKSVAEANRQAKEQRGP